MTTQNEPPKVGNRTGTPETSSVTLSPEEARQRLLEHAIPLKDVRVYVTGSEHYMASETVVVRIYVTEASPLTYVRKEDISDQLPYVVSGRKTREGWFDIPAKHLDGPMDRYLRCGRLQAIKVPGRVIEWVL